ncbi:MAG: hypothetical protein HQL02_07380 [Nitrospirae bacterium]|nr:hypothetical protein [Nitrospirota bacterium]
MCKDWDEYKTTNDLNLQALKEVIKSARAIAFIGAGCSIPLGYPSWSELIKNDDKQDNHPERGEILRDILIYCNVPR